MIVKSWYGNATFNTNFGFTFSINFTNSSTLSASTDATSIEHLDFLKYQQQ